MTGKIARLPIEIREQLNRRLRDGEQGRWIVQWLNALPEVQKVLAAEFAGHPVRQQNLSEWKQHGYREWLVHQEALDSLGQTVAEGEELKGRLGEDISEKLAGWMIPNFVAEARAKLAAAKNPDERWSVRLDLCANLVPLLRMKYYGDRLKVEKERLEVTRRLTKEQKDEEFEEWLKRPDVREKVRPKVTRDRAVKRTMQILDHCLMGGPLPDCEYMDDEEPEDPAALI